MISFFRRGTAVPALLLLCLLCIPFAGRAQAQQSTSAVLRGIVLSSDTNVPLVGAEIYITRLKRGTTTDDQGRFELGRLPFGTLEIQISHVGYIQMLRTVRIGAGESQALRVALEPRVVEAAEVIVIAEDPRGVSLMPLHTLTTSESDRIRSGSTSLWESLDALPGMARSTNGPGIERPYIRGLSGGRITVLLQNLPYAYQTWDPEAGLSMNGAGTEQVDVIQGPATLRYGPGAMGGVISLSPERPAAVGQTAGGVTGSFASNSDGLSGDLTLKHSETSWFWGFMPATIRMPIIGAGATSNSKALNPQTKRRKARCRTPASTMRSSRDSPV